MQDICMLLTWIRVKYCSALLRDLAWDKCNREAALALSGGRFVLRLKGNEEGKLIISHFSSLCHTFLPFISLSFLFFLCHPILKPSFIVSLPHSPIHCLQSSSPFKSPFPPPLHCDSRWLSIGSTMCAWLSFQPINTVYVLDVVHMNISVSWCFPLH